MQQFTADFSMSIPNLDDRVRLNRVWYGFDRGTEGRVIARDETCVYVKFYTHTNTIKIAGFNMLEDLSALDIMTSELSGESNNDR